MPAARMKAEEICFITTDVAASGSNTKPATFMPALGGPRSNTHEISPYSKPRQLFRLAQAKLQTKLVIDWLICSVGFSYLWQQFQHLRRKLGLDTYWSELLVVKK
jgi:hypothetical protein